MVTERLSDPQLYTLMGVFLGLGIAGLISVICWPLRDWPRDVGVGFRWVKR
ncbi:hypothetical protein ABIF38_006395 [Bradyrhizobium japonicum]|uniref:hypothetical protein n=1 Tax=Bradyrhizobium elkanii TaxID=29448 RepID=UPI000382D0C7|nr:hypothetical protein [Bradyrhizobium elkanii]WAX24326.1 hypothetical protein [Bradyrhizobium phage ppBeUSDA76-1]MCP1731297.1 hypothetical protein [Bradyrhizobium elkanii]MCS3575426.1 hypothetical protein [Bradyrhizobium elkanii]MCS3591883.1 hypothetical protein [Bradyrhizobium elkanii]MCS3621328.1 hypothetical protein [Bradyrhizobium elkanii]